MSLPRAHLTSNLSYLDNVNTSPSLFHQPLTSRALELSMLITVSFCDIYILYMPEQYCSSDIQNGPLDPNIFVISFIYRYAPPGKSRLSVTHRASNQTEHFADRQLRLASGANVPNGWPKLLDKVVLDRGGSRCGYLERNALLFLFYFWWSVSWGKRL